jgi:SAM-dependent methyltransferase
MTNQPCHHRDETRCRLAATLYARPADVTDEACAACDRQPAPREVNAVTVSLALSGATRDGDGPAGKQIITAHGRLLARDNTGRRARLAAVLDGTGVGSHLWRLLSSLGIEHRDDCDCLAWAERMNAWGPVGCRQQRAAIVQHMRDSASHYGWGSLAAAAAKSITTGLVWRLNPLEPYGSLLDEAIRRSEAVVPPPPPGPIDILLPLGPGSRYGDIELRIALRSIDQYASGLRRVVVVASRVPPWLRETDQVKIVHRKEFRCNKAARISQKVRWAFERLDITETVAFWNDDYVLTAPVDIRRIPSYYRGNLWRSGRDGWATLLNHTASVLRDAGRPQRHYDIHVPILFERAKFLGINDWWDRSRADRRGYVMKSIYGNIHCHGTSQTTKDCKVKADWKKRIGRVAKRRWVISYGDAALGTGLDRWLKSRYPKPSAAEKPAAKPCNHCGAAKSQYCIRPGYRSRPARNDNLTTTDGAQRCVYQHAAKIAAADPQVKTVLDWGCGTGAKLVEMFGQYQTLGVDVDYRLPTLRARFPDRAWGVVPVAVDADLVLCVDVIEHLDDPAELLRSIAAGRWRHLVISTPERNRVARHKYRSRKARHQERNGPPMNRWHAREWTADEFAALLRHELGATAEIVILRRWNTVAHVVR